MTTLTAPSPVFVAGSPVIPQDVVDAVWACARGSYQESVLRGREPWSGAGLAGKARQYGGKYAASRAVLAARIAAAMPAGWTATTEIVTSGSPARGHRELVLTAPGGQRYVW